MSRMCRFTCSEKLGPGLGGGLGAPRAVVIHMEVCYEEFLLVMTMTTMMMMKQLLIEHSFCAQDLTWIILFSCY